MSKTEEKTEMTKNIVVGVAVVLIAGILGWVGHDTHQAAQWRAATDAKLDQLVTKVELLESEKRIIDEIREITGNK